MLFAENETKAEPIPAFSRARPLAARLRPRDFSEYVGQQHIIGPGQLLRRAIEADTFTALILYGPAGVGKTSLAEVIAAVTSSHFTRLSAVGATVKDVRECVSQARSRLQLHERRTILFLDEIHRFNRAQQDVLLPAVENGIIRLIGATTENPFFHLVGPLVSRAQVFQLQPLAEEDIVALIRQACTDERGFPDLDVELTGEALQFLAQHSEGDARRTLTALELAVLSSAEATAGGRVVIDLDTAAASMQEKALQYGDDGHYDTASAFIKSMRGSDPDAAVYWLAKMLSAGEDPVFIARRVVIFASEDVGNADPRALSVAVSAMQAVNLVGMPEARIILSQAVTYCATAPKSNAALKAIDQAMGDIASGRVQPVPVSLRDAHYNSAARLGHGQGYEYPHDAPDHFVAQDYLGIDKTYYTPGELGYEKRIAERLRYWAERRQQETTAGAGKDSDHAE